MVVLAIHFDIAKEMNEPPKPITADMISNACRLRSTPFCCNNPSMPNRRKTTLMSTSTAALVARKRNIRSIMLKALLRRWWFPRQFCLDEESEFEISPNETEYTRFSGDIRRNQPEWTRRLCRSYRPRRASSLSRQRLTQGPARVAQSSTQLPVVAAALLWYLFQLWRCLCDVTHQTPQRWWGMLAYWRFRTKFNDDIREQAFVSLRGNRCSNPTTSKGLCQGCQIALSLLDKRLV